jgi:hypothetical protein
MSIVEDRAFYERRLKEERARASSACDETLRSLHLQWASLYEARLLAIVAQADTAGLA